MKEVIEPTSVLYVKPRLRSKRKFEAIKTKISQDKTYNQHDTFDVCMELLDMFSRRHNALYYKYLSEITGQELKLVLEPIPGEV